MTTIELLSRLRARDVQVWLDGERLRYRSPKDALTPDLRREIGRRKAEIVDFLREAAEATGGGAPAIEPVDRGGDLPLSFAQQRLWFLAQLEPGSPAYNVPMALRFDGPLDLGALARAANEIVRRHEVLRTTMPSVEGRPRQVIHAPAPVSLPRVDLAALPEAAREAAARGLATAEAAAPFDLARGPLCRLRLLRLGAADHVLLVTLHHIAADGWSRGLLTRELQTLYEAFHRDLQAPPPLPELPFQYADYAAWQRRWLAGRELERQVTFWKERLAGLPPVLELPGDRPYPAARTFRGGKVPIRIRKPAADALQGLAREAGGSLFMVSLALYQVLLGRYSGQRDVVVGTPIANRTQHEIEKLIGFFVNTLVLPLRGGGRPSFRALVDRVREVTLAAYAHQDLPFEKLVEEVDPDRDLSRHPLFQAMFVLQNAPAQALDLPGLRLRPMSGEVRSAKFDWNVTLWEDPRGLGGWLEYSSDLFDRSTALRAARHFAALAASAARDPGAAAFGLALLSPAERHELFREWSPPVAAGLDPPPVHELLAAQAERTPERLAAVLGERAMTYRELGRRSHQLAHRLAGLGVGPDVPVGICLERSLEMAVAVAGVLAAGGTYVPMDPAYPRERLDFMAADSGARVVVTQAAIASEVLRDADADLVLLDGDWSGLAGLPGDAPAVPLSRDHLLYVIYTSGSTGRPKGIGLSHLALANLIAWHLGTLLGASRTLQFASLSFDASFHEMFAAWASGGTVFLIREELRRDVDALARLLAEERIEKVIFPVVLLQRLAELYADRAALPLALREITSTGEQLHVTPALAEFVAGIGGCSFHNHYGPSETHVVTAYTLRGPHRAWPSHPPAGRPIDNAPVHVLDRWDNLAPAGVAGELFLGGVALARGYLGRPGLTAEKFVPHLLAGGERGARLYRTGDLARVLADGNVEFLGRIDHQVKIRGHRVELGEIESVLGRHERVRQCVVVAWTDRAGFPSLVAYFVPEGAPPGPAELRDFLAATLPEFMLPSYFVALEALPLSPNKKVDRKALPAPETRAADGGAAVEPRTPVEEGLAEIWRQVLGLEGPDARPVGVHESFFHLGGHSLTATQVTSRLRQLFGVELPVRRLFEAPTIAELAPHVERAMAGGRRAAVPPLVPAPPDVEGGLPLSFAQERLWFLDQLLPDVPLNHLPTALAVHGPLDVAALARALAAVSRRHETLRTSIAVFAGQPRQVVAPPGAFALPLVDLGRLPAAVRMATARQWVGAEARRRFDLTRGPLLRARVLRLAAEHHVLLFVFHHLVSDGWSEGILIREITALYEAARRGAAAALPELPVQYADFAVWQRSWLRGEALEAEIAFWRDELAGAPPVLELPADRPRPKVPRHAGASVPGVLPAAAAAAARAFAGRQGATIFMTLMAAFQGLLHRVTGQRSFCVGTPIAGRNQAQIEDLIGFFVNTLVLRAEISSSLGFGDLVARTRERALAAYAHQDLPFEKLVAELEPERDLSHAPLFQVMFVLQNAPRGELELRDLRFVRMAGDGRGLSRSDLGLYFGERDGRLGGHFEYKTGLFDRTTVARLWGRFAAFLTAALGDPETPLAELPLLAAGERHQLLVELGDIRQAEPCALALDQLIERQVERAPDAVALVAASEAWTYRGLDVRAGRVARHLRRLGVRREVVVGLSAERSPRLVAGLLGILKAGGAYLPLDPHYPAERLAFMLDDAQTAVEPRVVVTEERWRESFAGSGARAVCLDSDLPAEAQHEAQDLPAADPGHLAYVIYTSGSTGRPKGVLIEHAHVTRLLATTEDRFRFGPGDVWTFFHSSAFDFSVWEVFGALCYGGRLAVVPFETSRSPRRFLELLAEERVTVLNQTPSAFRQLTRAAESLPGAAGLALRLVIFGGEALEPQSLRPWYALAGDRGPQLVNMYGITETTVHVTWRPLARADAHGPAASPIGRPIPDLGIWLLDRHGRPVPAGTAGEIYVAGAGLARGYLGRPALTAVRFVPHPFAHRAGRRLYRSADLARRLASGDLEYLGRADHQVKIRGFRIELGEVEATAMRHPAVREAVVMVDGATPESRRLAAYLVPAKAGDEIAIDEVRGFLRQRLPEFMVPSVWAVVDELPLTVNRKVDRAELARRATASARAGEAAEHVKPRTEAESTIARIWRELLQVEHVGVHDNFFDLGGHSLLLIELQSRLRDAFGRDVPILDLFRYSTVAAQAQSLAQSADAAAKPADALTAAGRRRAELRSRAARPASAEVAVIGMAGRFPGAADPDELWRNLRDGVESVTFFADDELAAAGVPAATLENPSFVKAQARLEDVDLFDAGLFGFSPREAQVLDPQQRLFLECAWEALEEAGYDPHTCGVPIGVFAGAGLSRYWRNLFSNPELMEMIGSLQAMLGNDKDFLPTRVSYKLNLTGPSINVQTACSTALVAAHLACQSLLDRECDLALAGGVTLEGSEKNGYLYTPDGILSPDGHCRAFDAKAQGTIGGSGLGLVVLKRLDDALADGDVIRAVIKGSALNNDGSFKVGFTAPSIEGQAKVIAEAQAVAGVGPETVGYVEAHGTATPLGDPIEVRALREVFGSAPGARCGLGSVKTNVGHLGSAAGAVGLIKTVLALEHGQIPPSLHFEEPNPEIDFAASPFFVPTELVDWPLNSGPRRAGVSSFGLGGTNAHLVLEQAPEAEPSGTSRPFQLLVLSAKTETALETATERLAARLGELAPNELADAAFTLQAGRRRLEHRRILVCHDAADAAAALGARDGRRLFGAREEASGRGVAFLFPGLGDHYEGMARDLYRQEPTFREVIDRAAEVLRPILDEDLRAALLPETEEDGDRAGAKSAAPELDLRRLLGRGAAAERSGPLDRIELAHPAIFAVEVAVARLFAEWGVEPEAMIGYSLGEYTAAHLAGVFSFEDGLALVAERARLVAELPAGAMLAVPLTLPEVEPLLAGNGLAVAAANSPQVTVVAGPAEAVAALEAELAGRDVVSQRLKSRHAFHSTMMEPIAERLAARLAAMELHAPRIPYLSNVTGTWIAAREATDPRYWARHLCRTVRFADGVGELLDAAQPNRVLLEVGPGQALSTSARQHPAYGGDRLTLASLRDQRERQNDVAYVLGALGRLWLAGVDVDWRGFYRHEKRRRRRLPTYPFERQRYWIEARTFAAAAPRRSAELPKPDPADWFYVPSWKLSPPPEIEPRALEPVTWLLFADRHGLGARLAERLAAHGQDAVVVAMGEPFAGLDGGAATLDPECAEDYEELLGELRGAGRTPRHVVHLWSLGAADGDAGTFEELQRSGLYSVLYLARAIARQGLTGDLQLAVVADGLARVEAGEAVRPEKATLTGALKVLPQEYRNVRCRSFDVPLSAVSGASAAELAERLLADLAPPDDGAVPDLTVAYRRGLRWVEGYDPLPLGAPRELRPALRRHGVYLVTGGFGKVGRVVGRYLARTAGARLALVGRGACPPREEWDAWLEAHGEDDATSFRILRVRELEAEGAEVLPLAADAADREQMTAAVAAVRERFGTIHGLIHLAGLTARDQLLAPIEETGVEECRRHFRSKAEALYVLEEALADLDLDFRLLFSSLSTVLGGLGFAAYAAANAFMDAFAEARNAASGGPWLAVAWDGWRGTEEAADPAFPTMMAPDQSADAMHRVLAMRAAPRVVVSTADLGARLDRWVRFTTDAAAGEGREKAAESFARPQLQTAYVAPADELETSIAEVWQELLGIEGIGVHDNFFELGGDSLLATQVVSRLRRVVQVELPLQVFLNAPTVGQIAEIARQEGTQQKEELQTIEQLLAKVKGLSDEELDAALGEQEAG